MSERVAYRQGYAAGRDSLPTSLAIDDPKHVGAASAILGHADPRVTERHYNLAKSIEAGLRDLRTLSEYCVVR